MTIFQDFRALLVAVLVILVILGLIWNQRKTRPKTGPIDRKSNFDESFRLSYEAAKKKGYSGTYEQWFAENGPANRAERRNVEFAEVDTNATVNRRRIKQEEEFNRFLAAVDRLLQAGKVHRWSVFTFGKNVLQELEKALVEYNGRSMIQGRVETYVATYQWMLMNVVAQAITEYSGGKGLQAIALDLIKICEKYYKLNGLNGVLYRHKGHIHYNDRCEGMSIAIIRYFTQFLSKGAKEASMLPFDLLGTNELIPNEKFRRDFYQNAIDVTYSDIMQETERTNFAAQARKDQLEHEKNRRQRAKRVTRKKRR